MIYDPNCEDCALHKGCARVCLAAEGAKSKVDVLFVGGHPTRQDDREGRPFAGQNGGLLRYAIKEYGIDAHRIALTYAVKCAPEEEKTPKVAEVKACATYLNHEIAALQPRYIVPLGNLALRALTGLTGITKYVGRQLEHPSGAVVFPMIDPAGVWYDEARNKPTFEAGFEMLARALKGQAANTSALKQITAEEAIALLWRIAKAKEPFAFDIETGPTCEDPDGTLQGNPHFAEIDCAAIAWGQSEKETAWFAWPTTTGGRLNVLAALRKALESGAPMIAHNAVFETKWLLHRFKAPRTMRWRVEDTILFHHLLDENQKHGLEVLAAQHTDMGGYDNEVALLIAEGKTHHQIWLEQPEVLGRYCAGDALATYKAWVALRPQVFGDTGLRRVWESISHDAIFSVAWSELAGRKVDFDMLSRLRRKWTRESAEAMAGIMEDPAVKRYEASREAGGRGLGEGGFNPGSAQQVGDILFKHFRIPVLGKTDGGAPSVKAEYIEPFKAKHPWIDDYLTWKGRQKALEKLAEVEGLTAPDCFLYGSYLIFGTVTGRLSSANPNLQNFSPEARQIVVPRDPDGVIVEADYNQLELRIIAALAECQPLLDAFAQGLDPHAVTASRMYRIPVAEVTKEQRQRGKIANFLLAYGGGKRRLMISGGLTESEAEEVYDRFHAAYPELKAYLRKMERLCRGSGSVRSPVGRLRRLPDINSHQTGVRWAAAREAGNAPIQGTASDLNTWAYNKVGLRLATLGMRTVGLGLTHDSGTYDGPKSEVPRLAGILIQTMTHDAPKAVCPSVEVPFGIEIKWGPNWGSLKAYDGPVVNSSVSTPRR